MLISTFVTRVLVLNKTHIQATEHRNNLTRMSGQHNFTLLDIKAPCQDDDV